jgi:hypothetical protein
MKHWRWACEMWCGEKSRTHSRTHASYMLSVNRVELTNRDIMTVKNFRSFMPVTNTASSVYAKTSHSVNILISMAYNRVSLHGILRFTTADNIVVTNEYITLPCLDMSALLTFTIK